MYNTPIFISKYMYCLKQSDYCCPSFSYFNINNLFSLPFEQIHQSISLEMETIIYQIYKPEYQILQLILIIFLPLTQNLGCKLTWSFFVLNKMKKLVKVLKNYLVEELAAMNNHQEIINFCDRQIYFIEISQINQSENQTHILEDSQEYNKPMEFSSGSILLQSVDSFSRRFQIENAYDFYYKKKIKSLHVLQRYEDVIECCERLLILCQENNQEVYCQHEKAKALSKQGKMNEFIQMMGLDKQENKHNFNYYKQVVKNLKDEGLIEEAIACWDYGMQNNQFSEKFSHKKQKLLNKNEKIFEAEVCQKQLQNLGLS